MLGVVAGLALFEALLRLVLSPEPAPDGRRVMRQYFEGTTLAHFAADGARETGNPVLADAPLGIILGDSHIEALGVNDPETVGSVLERIARAAGSPLNVRQYGWTGASTPQYLAIADSLLRNSSPAWVAVVLNYGDITGEPLVASRLWRMTVAPDYSVRLVDLRFKPPEAHGVRRWLRDHGLTPSAMLGTVAQSSALGHGLVHRYMELDAGRFIASCAGCTFSSAPSEEERRVPLASVRALRQAYGDRLVVVYTPELSPSGDEPAPAAETALLDACVTEGVRCVDVRAALREATRRERRFGRGFHNSAPNQGHLNELGHRATAGAIWEAVAEMTRSRAGAR